MMQHSTSSNDTTLWRRVLAGVVVAVVAAITTLLVEGLLGSAANVVLTYENFLDHVADTAATGPYVTVTVLVVGVPIAVLLEWICQRESMLTTIAVFAVAGVAAGTAMSLVLTSDITLLLILPAAVAAAVGRGLADSLARRPTVLAAGVLVAAALTSAPILT